MSKNETDTSLSLLINNTFTYPDSCIATAKYHQDTFWGDLNLNCSAGTCSIIHMSEDSPLRFDNFTAVGADVDINLLSVHANTINVNVEKGTLTFNHAEVTKDSSLATADGDIVF